MAIINVMEKVVETKVEGLLKNNPDFCSCEHCMEDVLCLTLNKLPSKYTRTNKGELFSKVDQLLVQQNSLDIDVAIISAMAYVKNHPRHN